MFRTMTDSRRRSLAVLACITVVGLAGCAEAPAPAAQNAPQPTATPAAAQEAVGTPAPSAGEAAAASQATAVSQAAAGRAQVSAAGLLAYRQRMATGLQSYANALGALRERDRQLAERPSLIADSEWQQRTTTALRLMGQAADQMTEVAPVPPEMAATDGLIRRIERETRVLSGEYALGIEGASSAAATAAGSRTTPMLALLAQANVELRRGAA